MGYSGKVRASPDLTLGMSWKFSVWTDPEPLLQQPRRWASPEEALESSKELPRYGQMKTA